MYEYKLYKIKEKENVVDNFKSIASYKYSTFNDYILVIHSTTKNK